MLDESSDSFNAIKPAIKHIALAATPRTEFSDD